MDRERALIRHGFVLFLLGLVTGLVVHQLVNPRMGVSAHVEGVVNGIFLVVLGLAWSRIDFGARAETVAYWTGVVGAYANWAIPLFSAALGASRPRLAGAGHVGAPWVEAVFPFTLGVGLLPLACAALVVWGLRTRAQRATS